jgi:hypothetical protein
MGVTMRWWQMRACGEGRREGTRVAATRVVAGCCGAGVGRRGNGHLRGPAPLTSDRRMAWAALATAPPPPAPAPVTVPSPSAGQALSGAAWLGLRSACTDGRTGNFNGTALLDS